LPVNVVINGEAADEPCLVTVREGRIFVASAAPHSASTLGITIPAVAAPLTHRER